MPITEQESVAALPPGGWLRRYVAHAARQTTSPIGYHIGVGLTTLAVTCPLAYGMHYAGVLRANNFCLLVGRSGEDNKSSALHIAREILDAAAAPLIGDFPGSPEGLIESLANIPSQLIPISEFGKFLSSAQHGYFEPTKTLLADLWDCVDSKTEILTEHGWKSIGQIFKGDRVFALNPNTNRVELCTSLDVGQRAVRDGENLIEVVSDQHNIRVSEGHRIYYKTLLSDTRYTVQTAGSCEKENQGFYLPLSDGTLTYITPGQFKLSPKNGKEEVWCVTTEHGTIVTRRNGKIIILGNCLPTQRARANNKIIRVDDPRLSISAACSIPYLEKHTLAEDWTGGFMGRWMVVYARRERTDPDPVGDRTDFQWLVDELQKRALTQTAGWCIGLDGGAKRYWTDWYNDISNRNLPNNIIGIRARAPTICRKICLMYGWDFGPAILGQPWRIDVNILEPAIAFTELHIRSLIDLSNVIAEHADARLRRSVLMAIDQHGGVATLGEILSVLKMRKRLVTEHLDALIEEKCVAKVDTILGHTAFEHRRTL
jgi:hypothetical protein